MNRGASLIEIMIAGSLAALILTLTVAWLSFSGRQYKSATGASQISRDLDLAVHTLRRDLREAALLSIRSKPTGVTMSSARDVTGALQTNARGDVAWQGHILYTLRKDQGGPTGTVVRWFEESSGLLPQPTRTPAWPIKNEASSKIVLRGVVQQANHPVVKGLGQDETGFEVFFVRGDGTFSSLNPAEIGSEEEHQLNTGLVEVRLAVLPDARRGRESYTRIVFRVRPQR